ncbi:MAG TPA: hypothetical protein VLH35_02450 [Candidatus Acidoferrales bacterium]|nr:hypothetical protein [Candidatus Acidoferrales bacterium]
MRIIDFKVLAEKQACSKEEVIRKFVKEFSSSERIYIMSPDKAEAICFDPQEIQDLTTELSSGKIALSYLAEQLKLTGYQRYFVIEYLQKTGQITGELTYNTFTSNSTSKILLLEKSKAHKREHRRKMREKGK